MQWNLSIVDTTGPSVLFREVSLFQRLILYGTSETVLIREVSEVSL